MCERLKTQTGEIQKKASTLHNDEINILFFLSLSLSLFLHHLFQRKSNRIRMGVRQICLCQLHEHNSSFLYPAKIHSFALLVAKVRIESSRALERQRKRTPSTMVSWSFIGAFFLALSMCMDLSHFVGSQVCFGLPTQPGFKSEQKNWTEFLSNKRQIYCILIKEHLRLTRLLYQQCIWWVALNMR